MTSHSDNQRVITTCPLPCQLMFSPRELKFWWRQPSTEPTSTEHLGLGICTTRQEVRSKAHQMFQHLATLLLLGAELNHEENYNFATEGFTTDIIQALDQNRLP